MWIDIDNAALKNKPEADLIVRLLDDFQNDKLPDVNPTLPTKVESKRDAYRPNTETKTVPDTAEFVIVTDDNAGFANDKTCESITLCTFHIVTITPDRIPSPGEARHRMDDSENHSDSEVIETPIRTEPLRDE